MRTKGVLREQLLQDSDSPTKYRHLRLEHMPGDTRRSPRPGRLTAARQKSIGNNNNGKTREDETKRGSMKQQQ